MQPINDDGELERSRLENLIEITRQRDLYKDELLALQALQATEGGVQTQKQ